MRSSSFAGPVRAASRAFTACLVAASLVACDQLLKKDDGKANTVGGGSTSTQTHPGPVIDELYLPEGVSPIGGSYDIEGTISYHSDYGGVREVHVRVPTVGKTYVIQGNDEASAAGEPISIVLSADVPLGGAGAVELVISLVDDSGAEGQGETAVVVLQ